MRAAIAAVLLAAFPTTASADIDCAAFARAIDQGQRQLSKLRAEARATKREARDDVQARIQQELTLLQINTAILLRSSCPAPGKPISANAYSKAADTCEDAAQRSDAAAPLEACDTSKWSPDP
jgi:hypothetical protein